MYYQLAVYAARIGFWFCLRSYISFFVGVGGGSVVVTVMYNLTGAAARING